MKIIEDYSQLLDWAERANTCINLKARVDMQDEFGRSNAKLMEQLFLKAVEKDHRRIILFGVYKIMGDQWLETYIRIWMQAKAEDFRSRVLADLEEREQHLESQRQIFLDSQKPIFRKFRKMKNQIVAFENQVKQLKEESEYHQKKHIDAVRELINAKNIDLRTTKESTNFKTICRMIINSAKEDNLI